jgi:hypothetical protein
VDRRKLWRLKPPAILVRNVSIEGYKAAIKSGDKLVPGPQVEEFVSSLPMSLFNSPQKTLNLAIAETPEFFESDLKIGLISLPTVPNAMTTRMTPTASRKPSIRAKRPFIFPQEPTNLTSQ